jgi:hypothetical protein
MEEGVFRRPAVAGVLKEGFIEARLHNDTGPIVKETVEREKKLASSVATPTYVTIDPKTGATLNIQHGPLFDEQKFIEFLRTKALE